MAENNQIKIWMYKVDGENIALLLGIIVTLVLGYIFSTINFWIFIGLLIFGLLYVRLSQAQELGNSIRVHQNQFPEIYEIFKEYAERLGISKANLYIKQDPYINAYTLGLGTCTVILNSALVEQLTFDELKFVIGHELGHFKTGHTKVTTFINPLGNGNVFSNYIFGFWQRKAELTCDRCGLLLTKDINSSISALLKISLGEKLFKKFDIDGYLPQLKLSDSMAVKTSELLISHPTTANRIRHILNYWNENFHTKQK